MSAAEYVCQRQSIKQQNASNFTYMLRRNWTELNTTLDSVQISLVLSWYTLWTQLNCGMALALAIILLLLLSPPRWTKWTLQEI